MLINYSRERDEISRPNQVGGEYLHDLWNIRVDKRCWLGHAITRLEAAHPNEGKKDHQAKLSASNTNWKTAPTTMNGWNLLIKCYASLSSYL